MPAAWWNARRAPAIFDDPQHPYTLGLLGSIPKIEEQRDRLLAIEGTVPPPFDLPPGCRFHPRCVFADAACTAQDPPLRRDLVTMLIASPASALRRVGGGGGMTVAPSLGRFEGPAPGTSRHSSQGLVLRRAPSAWCARWTASPSRSTAARRWRWSANPAAASPPPRAGAAADRPDRRDRPTSRAPTSPTLTGDAAAQAAPAHADRVPGPVRLAEPAHDGGRDPGRAADRPRHRRPRRRAAPA